MQRTDASGAIANTLQHRDNEFVCATDLHGHRRILSPAIAACLTLAFVACSSDAATFTVSSPADAGGACPGASCTLRQAIATAAAGDTITFAAGLAQVQLTSAQLLIDKNLVISGPGADKLAIVRMQGSGDFRIFDVTASSSTISGLTISNGSKSADAGGGIRNSSGTLNIAGVTLSTNSAMQGAAVASLGGDVTIVDSTLSGNTASDQGGGIYVNIAGTLTVVTSTISGNQAASYGGGIAVHKPTSVHLINSTITANSAGVAGGGIDIELDATVTVKNTIIARNMANSYGPDIDGAIASQGYNLIGNTGGVTNIGGTTTGNQLNVDPLLGPLQNNGGPTNTHALLTSSPAIEAGQSGGYATDQRGLARTVDSPSLPNAAGGDGADIGAYEVQADQLPGCSTIDRVVHNNNDSGVGSLRDVIASVCGGSTITFAAAVRGAINLTSAELALTKSVWIAGPGANLLTVQRSSAPGTPSLRIFNTNFPATTVQISGLTIANGSPAAGASGQGGAIYNAARLTINECTISGNTSGSSDGGGIYNTGGNLTINNSTLWANTAFNGGAIFNANNTGAITIVSSTISGNSASGAGGALDTPGSATILSSTIAGNSAGAAGGGGIFNSGGTVSARNTIIALNSSTSGPDINGGLTSQGFNLIGDATAANISPVQLSDQIAVSAQQLNLGPLGNNGGRTPTRALLPGSFAIDQGHSSGLSKDQRGLARVIDVAAISNVNGGDGADIGAFEFGGLNIDVDGNRSYDALTDGLLIVRYLAGQTGAALNNSAVGASPTRDAAQMLQFLDAIAPALDIDGDGQTNSYTDGLLVMRYLFGLRGSALTAGALGPNPTRSVDAIEAYIQSLMP